MATSTWDKDMSSPSQDDKGGLITQDQNSKALDILATALLGDHTESKISPSLPALKLQCTSGINEVFIGIIPLDLFAWNLWLPWDTLKICAVGTPSTATFFELACSRFLDNKDNITIVNADKITATFDLCIASLRTKLSYHSNPLVAKWSQIDKTTLAEIRPTLPWISQDGIDDLIRTQEIATKLAQYDAALLHAFRLRYLSWAVHLGLFPNLLTSEHIICMAIWVLNKNSSQAELDKSNLPVPDIGKEVEDVATSIGFRGIKLEAWRLGTVRRIAAHSQLRSQGFLKSWPWYLKVDLKYWGSSNTQANQWISKLENSLTSTTLSCSKDTYQRALFHLWPHPFVDDREAGGEEYLLDHFTISSNITGPYQMSAVSQTSDFTYFIGFSSLSEDEGNLNTASICSHFAEFEALSGPDCSCAVEVVPLTNMTLEWGSALFKRIAVPADLRKHGIADDKSDKPTEEAYHSSPCKCKKCTVHRRHDKQTSAPSLPSEQTKSSLRPAVDILNRIRHDSSFNTDDFLVGYLDRHSGIQELAVDQWVAENTDEAFIPQSRIRYFKRKSDGVLVWDRDARIDRVFGSGRQGS